MIMIDFGRRSKAPIFDIDLNKSIKPQKHYYLSPKFKEFIIYGIEFQNMKRVLTLRT